VTAARGGSSPIAAGSRRLRSRADALVAGDPAADILELDNLITDACATVLELRRRQRHVERRLSALITADDDTPTTAGQAARFAREARDLRVEIKDVQALIDRLTPYRRAWERDRAR
jgi:hypothetical protein